MLGLGMGELLVIGAICFLASGVVIVPLGIGVLIARRNAGSRGEDDAGRREG